MPPNGMQPYQVLFRDWDPTLSPGDRGAWVDQQSTASAAEVECLRAWIHENGLDTDLGRIGHATVFGSVDIMATRALVSRLRRWDRVKAVVPGNL